MASNKMIFHSLVVIAVGMFITAKSQSVLSSDNLPPLFQKSVYYCNVSEDVIPATTICQVTAEYQTAVTNSTILYSIRRTDTDTAKFTVDDNGHIKVNRPLDREAQSTYFLLVKAYEQGGAMEKFDKAVVIFTVTDVDDNLPIFKPHPSEINIMENTPIGTLVFQFTAQDNDEGINAAFTYNLTRGMEAFQIDNDGKLTVKDATELDREMISALSVQVEAHPLNKDHGLGSTRTSMYIILMDENDNSPIFAQRQFQAVVHNDIPLNTFILQLKATDADEGKNGELAYSLLGNGNLPFRVDNLTGNLYLETSLIDKKQASYSFAALAEDQAIDFSDRRIGVALVTVMVIDVVDQVIG